MPWPGGVLGYDSNFLNYKGLWRLVSACFEAVLSAKSAFAPPATVEAAGGCPLGPGAPAQVTWPGLR